MSYIIPITFFSVIVLFLTTIKKTVITETNDKGANHSKHHAKNGKEIKRAHLSIDASAFSNIIQQIVIVFLSALLAMALTEYVENKMSREQASAFLPQMQNSIVSQFSKIGGEIKDINDALEEGKTATDEQLLKVAKIIANDDLTFLEAMLYNEKFVSTVSPMSYMFLNMDVSQMKKCAASLSDMSADNADNINRRETAETIAEYLYCCTDAAFSMDILKEDITFDLVTLAMLDKEVFYETVYYELYDSYIVMLEEAFDVDLESYEGKIRYNNASKE